MDSKVVSDACQLRDPGDITTICERGILIVAAPVADAEAAAEVPVAVDSAALPGQRSSASLDTWAMGRPAGGA